jgi:hypothetical protein
VVRGGTWLINNSFDATADSSFGYGGPLDLPVVGSWDGDPDDTQGLVRGGN